MEVLKVKDYNREQIKKWELRVKNWDYKKGGFPNLCFYTFSTPKGLHRQRGFVIRWGDSAYFRLTKKEVKEFLKEK